MSHGDAVNVSQYVVQGREAAGSGELIRSGRGKLGTVAGVKYWPEHIRGVIFTDPRRYLADPSANHGGNSTNPRAAHRRRGG